MDCSCSAFLAAAAFKLFRIAQQSALLLPNAYFVAFWPCHSVYPVSVEVREVLFEKKCLYSSTSLIARTDFAISLQSAEFATDY